MKTKKMSLANIQGKLGREEMKNIMAGNFLMCSLSANCIKQEYNSTTHNWESHNVGTVACSGVGECSSTSTTLTCPQSSGQSDSATCPPGSYIG